MAIDVIKLDQGHVQDVISVMNSRSSFSGIPEGAVLDLLRDQQMRRTYNMLDPAVLKSGMCSVYGAWEDGLLKATMYTAISEHQVCYYITRAYTIPGSSGAALLGALVAKVIADHEALGYYRFLTVYQKKNLSRYQRLLNKQAKNYISFTEVEVPAVTPPKQLEIWEKLYGRTLIPEDTVVRTFVRPMGDVRC